MTEPIDIVNEYRALTGRDIKFVSNEFAAMRFLTWCKDRCIPPLRFLKARILLAQKGGREFPAIRQLPSEGLAIDDAWADILDDFEGPEKDAQFVAAETAKHDERLISTLLAATPAQEKFKLNVESSEICENQQMFSGGYHPKSLHCTLCIRAGSCAERVNRMHGFDVIMIRLQRGHIGYVKVE